MQANKNKKINNKNKLGVKVTINLKMKRKYSSFQKNNKKSFIKKE